MQQTPSIQERRLVFRLLKHWRDIRGEGLYPPAGPVNARLSGDILPCTFELVVGEPGETPCFRRIGDALRAGLPSSVDGLAVSALPADSLLAHAVRPWAQVLRRGLPISIGGEFVDSVGRDVVYRTIVLPMSEDGVRIDALLGGANSKAQEVGAEIGAVSAVDAIAAVMAGERL